MSRTVALFDGTIGRVVEQHHSRLQWRKSFARKCGCMRDRPRHRVSRTRRARTIIRALYSVAMHAQLAAIVEELESAERRLRVLQRDLDTDAWRRRPEPGRWSALDCIAHLNATSRAFVPLLRQGVAEARELGGTVRRYWRDPIGWMIWAMVSPRPWFRTRTAAAFEPSTDESPDELVREFHRLQAEQIALTRESDGLSIHRVTLASPFDARARYTVYAALTIIPRHQHRHLYQAERAAQAIGSGR